MPEALNVQLLIVSGRSFPGCDSNTCRFFWYTSAPIPNDLDPSAYRCSSRRFLMLQPGLLKHDDRPTFCIKKNRERIAPKQCAFHSRLSVYSQRYNTLDFAGKVVCQKGTDPLWTPQKSTSILSDHDLNRLTDPIRGIDIDLTATLGPGPDPARTADSGYLLIAAPVAQLCRFIRTRKPVGAVWSDVYSCP